MTRLRSWPESFKNGVSISRLEILLKSSYTYRYWRTTKKSSQTLGIFMNPIIRNLRSGPSIGASFRHIYIMGCASIAFNGLQMVFLMETFHQAHKIG